MKGACGVRLDGRSIALNHLDITNCLSAPNRINTGNKHAGTVCRIFIDLSDMGWLEKHTALYESATNRLDKICNPLIFKQGKYIKMNRVS